MRSVRCDERRARNLCWPTNWVGNDDYMLIRLSDLLGLDEIEPSCA